MIFVALYLLLVNLGKFVLNERPSIFGLFPRKHHYCMKKVLSEDVYVFFVGQITKRRAFIIVHLQDESERHTKQQKPTHIERCKYRNIRKQIMKEQHSKEELPIGSHIVWLLSDWRTKKLCLQCVSDKHAHRTIHMSSCMHNDRCCCSF